MDKYSSSIMRVRIFICLFFLPFTVLTQADTLGKNHLVVSGIAGSIIPHRQEMIPLIKGYSLGGSIQWMRRPMMPKWRIFQRYPITGFDLYFSTTGNPKQLGYQTALSYLIYRPYGKKNKWWYGMGMGIGYNSKQWDLENNHQATVISTKINCALTLHWQYKLFTTPRLYHFIGCRLTHLSNGSYQLPNLGTNQLQLSFTIQPKMDLQKRPFAITDELPYYFSSKILSFQTGCGIKETYQPLGSKYPVWNVQLNYARMMNYQHRWSLGIDYLYQPALEKLFEKNLHQQSSPKNWQQWGATVGFQSIFGNTSFIIQQGVYIKSDWKNNGPLYQRLSIKRNCTQLGKRYPYLNRLFVTAALFTHWAKADHFEFGCGIDLYRR